MGMINSITFNGYNSRDYGVFISGNGVFNAPERDYEMVSVPGRNGDIILDNGRWRNIEVTYPAFIVHDFADNIRDWANILLMATDYVEISDTYNTDEFRLGRLAGGLTVDPVAWLTAGRFDLTFNCKPQRFLTSGETVISLNASGTVTNPTMMVAKPLLRVYGSGTITVGDNTITVSSHSYSYIDIDCELQEAYYGSVNCNAYISANDFISFNSGTNSVVLSGLTSVDITPRWWRL